jgi:carbamoyltransferase
VTVGELTGVPVLLNTSFNRRGEPIVTTPREALEAFEGTALDLLAVEDTVVEA